MPEIIARVMLVLIEYADLKGLMQRAADGEDVELLLVEMAANAKRTCLDDEEGD